MITRPDPNFLFFPVGAVVGVVVGVTTGGLVSAVGMPGDPKAIAYSAIAGAYRGGIGGAIGGGTGAIAGTAAAIVAQNQFNFLQNIGVLP